MDTYENKNETYENENVNMFVIFVIHAMNVCVV